LWRRKRKKRRRALQPSGRIVSAAVHICPYYSDICDGRDFRQQQLVAMGSIKL
jgi:hypothetical protein